MQKKSARGMVVGGLLAGAGVLLLGGLVGLSPRSLDTVSAQLAYPFLRLQHALVEPVEDFFQKRKTYAELHAELVRVQAERDELVSELAQVLILLDFHDQTDELVAFKKRYEDPHAQLAQVLVKQLSEQSHYFLVDKGTNHGITTDMVAVYKQCLVGKVVAVYPAYSRVQLITDAQCSVAACCSVSRAEGIHEGANTSEGTKLRYVSHLAKVKPGDIVFSSGEGLIFPRGFALGSIASCVKNGLYFDIAVKPLLDIAAVKYCYLMQKGADSKNEVHPPLIAASNQKTEQR